MAVERSAEILCHGSGKSGYRGNMRVRQHPPRPKHTHKREKKNEKKKEKKRKRKKKRNTHFWKKKRVDTIELTFYFSIFFPMWLHSGGNLAAVLVLEAACLFPSFKPVLMLLIVPVIDNTALPGEGWYNLHSPWLTPARMLWYRRMYLPHGNGRDERYPERENWQTSPNLAPSKILSRCPPTWLAVAEYDLLATEALAFSSQLRASGVQTTVKVYPGSTHAILALSGVLSKGRELMLDAAQALNGAFWPIRMDPLLGWTLCSS